VLVYVHGGAWREPLTAATSAEATVAHAFSEGSGPISVIVSIDYSLSPFPNHALFPYGATQDWGTDPAREAMHPQHVSDVLRALAFLRGLGLSDDSYLIAGHSSGACIAAQAAFGGHCDFGADLDLAPRPAALLGFNGIYDLPSLVEELGPEQEEVRAEYAALLTAAFGTATASWEVASPARFPRHEVIARVAAGVTPRVVLLDHSVDDRMVPAGQKQRFMRTLSGIDGLRLVDGHRCTGEHAAPWRQGHMIWESVLDVLPLLAG
jgi:acetyl esterase/lipase